MTGAPRSGARPAAKRSPKPAAAPAWRLGDVNLLIGTPAYGGLMHMDHVHGLFEFARAGIRFRMSTIGNESLITRARNAILANFHAAPDFTHLLFLDADVRLPAGDLIRMLSANVPVIGAPVALKTFDEQGNRIWNLGRTLGTSGALIKVENVGTAALLLSRAACTALVEDALAHGRVYQKSSLMSGALNADLHYDVFQVGVHDGIYLSEDYWACRRLHALGFDILIDPAAITTHHGTMAV